MTTRNVVLAGATGLVGREILNGLLADASVSTVHALVRRPLDIQHPKLTVHVVAFNALPRLPAVDEAYLALGTTIKVAGSQAVFRAVDFDANLTVARAAKDAGVRHIGVVSAMGANTNSSVFYNRVKGELEEALTALGFEGLVLARPSLLTGNREALGQPSRAWEKLAITCGSLLRPLIRANYRPIDTSRVAYALLKRVPTATGVEVLLSGVMQS